MRWNQRKKKCERRKDATKWWRRRRRRRKKADTRGGCEARHLIQFILKLTRDGEARKASSSPKFFRIISFSLSHASAVHLLFSFFLFLFLLLVPFYFLAHQWPASRSLDINIISTRARWKEGAKPTGEKKYWGSSWAWLVLLFSCRSFSSTQSAYLDTRNVTLHLAREESKIHQTLKPLRVYKSSYTRDCVIRKRREKNAIAKAGEKKNETKRNETRRDETRLFYLYLSLFCFFFFFLSLHFLFSFLFYAIVRRFHFRLHLLLLSFILSLFFTLCLLLQVLNDCYFHSFSFFALSRAILFKFSHVFVNNCTKGE